MALANQSEVIPYYGDQFYQDLKDDVSDLSLQESLKTVFNSSHTLRPGYNDLLSESCKGAQGRCYRHTVIGYGAAKLFVTRQFYLAHSGAAKDSNPDVQDVYCSEVRPLSQVNVEHTWPQSRFNKRFPKDMQKSDLHHLFPTDIHTNAVRGNHIFGEVTQDLRPLKCRASRFGLGSAGSDEVFQPPTEHRGNVARALFYFAIRYDLKISTDEEKILRKWHLEDPVQDEDVRHNNAVFRYQGTRNPFIDFPDLVYKISDF